MVRILAQETLLALYAGVVDDDAWRAIPGLLTSACEGDNAVLWVKDAAGFASVSHLDDPEGLALYAERYHALDPWTIGVRDRALVGQAFTGQDLVDDVSLRNSEFYADFMRPTNTAEVVGAVLDSPDFGAGLGIHRALHCRFGDRQREQLQAILPHLAQVIRLRSQMGARCRNGDAAGQALEHADCAIVVCNPRGIVRYANQAAETMARTSDLIDLGSVLQPLAARPSRAGRALHEAIVEAGSGAAGRTLRLAGEGSDTIFATVAPLAMQESWPREPLVLVSLRGPAIGSLPDPDVLRELFGLTLAEAEVALGLLANRSIGELVRERDVSENTIRSQLGQVLAKTSTANQRELVRLLGCLS